MRPPIIKVEVYISHQSDLQEKCQLSGCHFTIIKKINVYNIIMEILKIVQLIYNLVWNNKCTAILIFHF